MKKLNYLIISIAAITIVACSGKKNAYTISGTVAGATDSNVVYIQKIGDRKLIKMDSTVIKNGTFSFKGTQDSIVDRYITCNVNGQNFLIDFFLEPGNIKIDLNKKDDSATGTKNNDIYQEIRMNVATITNKMNSLYNTLGSSTLNDQEKETNKEQIEKLNDEYTKIYANAVDKNITNPVGVYLFKQTYYENSAEKNDSLLAMIPTNYQNDETIVKIKATVKGQKETEVGKPYKDFEMQTPEGKTIKLSDFVGKGKVVLIDFWASWCGPCRQEMPNMVAVYAKYKGPKFEIVGVSLDKDAKSWKAALGNLKMTWPQMSDLNYWDNKGAKLYSIASIPQTILIDTKGMIIARGLRGEELQAKLSEILK